MAYTYDDMLQMARQAGFQGSDATRMAAIAMAESGGNPAAVNRADPGGSYGLTQINGGAHGLAYALEALNPQTAFDHAHDLYARRGNFNDWSTYTSGAYARYLPGGAGATASYAGGGNQPNDAQGEALLQSYLKPAVIQSAAEALTPQQQQQQKPASPPAPAKTTPVQTTPEPVALSPTTPPGVAPAVTNNDPGEALLRSYMKPGVAVQASSPAAMSASVQPAPSAANAGVSGFVNGLPVVGPYAQSGLQKLTAWGQSQATGQPYGQALSDIQQFGQASQAAYPKTALAGNVGGAIAGTVPMMAAAPAAFGVGVASPFAASALSAGTGAALGGADAAARSGGNLNATGQGALLGGVFGAAGPLAGRVAGGLTGALGNATIGSMPANDALLASVARGKYGIPVNAGQMAPANSFARYAGSALDQLPFSGAAANQEAVKTGVMRAIARTIGEDADRLTPDVMNHAVQRIGNDFDTVANNTTMHYDGQFAQDLTNALNLPGLTRSMPEFKTLQGQIYNVYNAVDKSSGTMSGQVYQTLTNANSTLGKMIRSSNPTLSQGASAIKDAMQDWLTRYAPQDMQDLAQQAKSQWKNLKTIEPLVAESGTGEVSPVKLAQRINSSPYSTNAMAYGRAGDLGEIAAIGRRFLKEPPNSGTAIRNLIYSGLGTGAAALGMNEAGLIGGQPASPYSALAIPAALLAGRFGSAALRSPWLANALINRSLAPMAAAARPSALATNLLTRTIGPAETEQQVPALSGP